MNELDNDIIDAVARLLCNMDEHKISELGIYCAQKPQANLSVDDIVRVSGNALGIASWALTPLYLSAKKRIISSRTDFRAASVLLAVNPDYATAWSVRKELLLQSGGEILNDDWSTSAPARELSFVSLILRRDPKSVEAWSHRSWVFRNYGWHGSSIAEELRVCAVAASSAPCNYYAGVHRLRVLRRASYDVVLQEIAETRQWLQTHVSDSSGWWYHMSAVQLGRLSEMGAEQEYAEEICFANDMLQRYGERYESVEKYHHWLLKFICPNYREST